MVAGVFVRSVFASLACSFGRWCVCLMVLWVHLFGCVCLLVRWFNCSLSVRGSVAHLFVYLMVCLCDGSVVLWCLESLAWSFDGLLGRWFVRFTVQYLGVVVW